MMVLPPKALLLVVPLLRVPQPVRVLLVRAMLVVQQLAPTLTSQL